MSEPLLTAPEHKPVMPEETVDAWLGDPDGFYVDGTFGRGGHSRLLLQKLGEKAELLAMDRDMQAIAEAEKLRAEDDRVRVEHGAFADMRTVIDRLGWTGKVSGILLDLGVSSPQLDNAERGFSFMRDGPLDMRMDTTAGQSAADWLATAGFNEIADVLRKYGEEKFAGRIARAIVEQRELGAIDTTGRLVELIENAVPKKDQGKHKATRTFQALRIQVNHEIDQLEKFLGNSIDLLAIGGRLAIISFHSLEDRIVKRFMREQARGNYAPKRIPVKDSELNRRIKIVVRACKAADRELIENPRARSAILRAAERLA